MLREVDRLHRVVDDYERIGRVQPILRAVDVNEIVRSVVALEPFAAADGITITSELASELPKCTADGDLVSGALQNVIRNAFEAMPKGGKLTVRTERVEHGVVITVEDSGDGMDARQAERALDDFYTTKPAGSGLGLAFVRRVAQAHGGDVSLKSTVGVGTIVRLRLSAV
jgi:signal transduction histidine kinase